MGNEEAEILLALQSFREWAVMVAISQYDTDWVVPVDTEAGQAFAFSLEAYNYFAMHSNTRLKSFRNDDELYELLKKNAECLYREELEIKVLDSGFFMLPDRLAPPGSERKRDEGRTGNEYGQCSVTASVSCLG